ncbi:retinoid-inducible serine carboxypeptidase isoform X2 [Ranitomeya imitator]|uniref:retinoid-inducible serine carboxypeptidase isoform X2 n=1 Tax=Ranitomeya imitator TaxID=111125 RepID=UPI0037E7A1DA
MTGNMAATGGLLLATIALLSLQPAAGRPARMTEAMEDWGYVTVRKDAHMFWWLYYANHPTRNYTEVPLVMWLQGGPGASGCGFGNFEEIGPRDTNLFIRNSSWDRVASLLFVDSPVGSGYSYTTDGAAFAKDVDTVASDMMVLLEVVFTAKPEFQKTPFYIFSESYGGKMAAAIGLVLQKAISAGRISCTFGGVALGDSWISPIDSVLSWGPYLYSINTDGVNFYNILSKESLMRRSAAEFSRPRIGRLFQRHVQPLQSDVLDRLMNGPIRKLLRIIPDEVRWGGQAALVFENMAGDFMKPVVDVVDELLSAGINVTVYNGQLDLIVDTVGQESWVKQLQWKRREEFRSLHWRPLHLSEAETAAFYKRLENFSFYWILKAGHMVPADQPWTSLQMLRMIMDQQ